MDESEPVDVLIVDDDPDLAALTATSLERTEERLQTTVETNVEQALKHLQSESVDCIVSDYDMPGRNGLAFLEAVRVSHPDLPFILFTGKGSEEIASEAIAAGVTDYLQKSGRDQYTILANRLLNAVERWRAERQHETALDALNTAEEGICVLDETGSYDYVNRAYGELFGQDPASLAGESVEQQYVDSDAIGQAITTARGEGSWRGTLTAVHAADGNQFPAAHSMGVTDDGRIVCAVRDVSDRERYERQLKQLQEVTRDLMETVEPDDIAERAVAFAKDALDLPITAVGRDDEDGEGLSLLAATDEAIDLFTELPSFSGDRGLSMATLESGEPVVLDDVRQHPMTSTPGVEVRSTGIFPLGDHGVLITGSTETGAFDATDADFGRLLAASVESALDRAGRERTLRDRSAELAETTRTLEAVIEAAPVPIVAVDSDQQVELWNPAAERLFGWDAESVKGGDPPHVPEDQQASFEGVVDSVTSGTMFDGEEVIRQTRNGERLHLQLYTAPIRGSDDEIRGSLGVFLDISDRKAYEQQLTTLHEVARDLMRAADRETIAEVASNALHDVLGHPINAVRYVDDDEESLVAAATTEAAEQQLGERPAYSIAETAAGTAYREGRTVQSTVDPADHEFRTPRHRLYVPVGEYGVFGVGDAEETFDESEIRLAEVLAANVETALDRLERERRLERQNERLEEFTSVVSHDLRNPLMLAQGRLDIAMEERGRDEHLTATADALDRMEELIEALLTLARQGQAVGSREPVDVGMIARKAWSIAGGADATLRVNTPGTVHADPKRLRQLLENLFANAVEHGSTSNRTSSGGAVEHGGTDVTVTVGALADGQGFFVADDGDGLDDPDQVFEWGFSTDRNNTGYGLAIVAEIADAHGWTVRATESESGGARFEVVTSSGTSDGGSDGSGI